MMMQDETHDDNYEYMTHVCSMTWMKGRTDYSYYMQQSKGFVIPSKEDRDSGTRSLAP